MSANSQNNLERLKDLMQRGELTTDQANVEMVRMDRVRIVKGRMPAQVRKVLNAAVKRGELAHMKKDGHKPECYYHPTFDYLARGERARHEDAAHCALAKIAGFQ
ncbi:MAG TPA: hypothetical protein VFM75_12830 [Modicisalibacter sp.]|nr:hypothetical protein [Modicisalibacter sp.]